MGLEIKCWWQSKYNCNKTGGFSFIKEKKERKERKKKKRW